MKSVVAFFAALPTAPWAAAVFSFNLYDLGFRGLYPHQHFQSTDLEPLKPVITQWDEECDNGNLFFTVRGPHVQGFARGPVITDARGELVWMDNDRFREAMNLNVQRYRGEDFLTFWTKHKKTRKDGTVKSRKSFVMLNSSYEVAHRIKPVGKGLKGDSHEFRITPQGTALIVIYKKHKTDCTTIGLGKSCWIQDGWFQEIDIATGELLFEWKATEHIKMTDVFSSPNRKDGHGTSKKDAFDFFHMNSVDKTDAGDFIVSARYMHAVLGISGRTGEILWQLGGKNNHFQDLGGALDFSWQHHVTWQGDDTISLFDNHANDVRHSRALHSSGKVIKLDMARMTAELVREYAHPDHILNISQGSVQVVNETGNVLVGFGNSPTYVEFAADGEVLCQAHFAPRITFEIVDFGWAKSYRIFKHPWVGRPKTVPDVKVKRGKVYVSWNGATEVAGWRLETSGEDGGGEFVAVREVQKSGFESSFMLDKVQKYVRVVALDAQGEALASSATVSTIERIPKSFWTAFWCMFALATLVSSLIYTLLSWKSKRTSGLPLLRLLPQKQKTHVRFSRWKDIRMKKYWLRGSPSRPDDDPSSLGEDGDWDWDNCDSERGRLLMRGRGSLYEGSWRRSSSGGPGDGASRG
ncbi:uncharacterized protein L3040_006829 [Drepanopeziza brunnea f. sp. 'multigermtubi']|uniref:uncharacterized protein n=1 Tax=Drepanopeziza brunnea f. sp. 'multigermtubi' TaxID=698441 RepID=UPI0023890959|nr:hypothetical protein L3040_006829 [Drepanopeziza brunnea f. sp. 'multigermtubi']